MASSDPQGQLSLIPYPSDSREVVLRHGSSVVVYDPQSRELSLRREPDDYPNPQECPWCHRPMKADSSEFDTHEDDAPLNHEDTFVNPEYFRMLARSIPASPNPSRPPSPFKQLNASHGEDSRDDTASAQRVPANADFTSTAPTAPPASAEHGIQGSSFAPNYFKSFFVEKRELGRGGRGVVLLVEHVLDRVSLGEFACKRIPVGNDHDWLEKVLVEVQLLQRLDHPNLVSYRHVWLEDAQITNFGPSVPCIFILQQYCNAGDLHDHVLRPVKTSLEPMELKERLRRKSRGHSEMPPNIPAPRKMQFDEIFSFFRDITSGLHHLHKNNYIHRDLKPSNCLLHKVGQKLTVHVSDFGEVQTTSAKRASTGATGTISYCAPEVLKRETPDGEFGNFSTKSDIFSLGMIVYFMCFGHLPYASADELNDENEDIDQLRLEVSRWNGFDESIRTRTDLPERLYSFLKRLLSPDPAKRPSTGQILQAIKAGGDIDVPAHQMTEPIEPEPRITSVDTPSRKLPTDSRIRRPPAEPRPSLTPVGRHQSSGELIPAPASRLRESFSENATSTDRSGVVTRSSWKAENPVETEKHGSEVLQSTRLIMPPPLTMREKAVYTLEIPHVVHICKAVAFCLKLLTLSWPCSPYAARPFLFYPLVMLSMLDFWPNTRLSTTLWTTGLHVLIWSAALLTGQLCTISPSSQLAIHR
ncbi:hypothetical protein AAFC00_006367 [Neodothiora populina]|uniref:Protein kinase domain-containing protein n=1 Tax=Neodothiora populina TaxID=2781224 RepID=A0ABR3P5C2_9PEZI